MKKKIYFILALTCVLNLCCCSKIFEALADGKDAVLENLINGKNALLDSAANLADDEVKDTILNAINSVNEAGGKTALTNEIFLQGKRTEGEDSYTGTYQADYTRFSGTEILFGGTTVECEKGSTVEVECTLTIEEGEAIIFLQSGNNDPTVILQANDTFTGKFEVGNGSSYFGIWGEEFTGSAELNIE